MPTISNLFNGNKNQPRTCRKACDVACALHNFLQTQFNEVNQHYIEPNNQETIKASSALSSLKSTPINYTKDAKDVREAFCTYFNNYGAVSWQDDYI